MAIVCNDIVYRYPGSRCDALTHVTMHIEKGEFWGIAGISGSGKTTLARCLSGQLKPQQGRVSVDGIEVGESMQTKHHITHYVGHVQQSPERQLFAETVFEDVAFGPRNAGLSEKEVEARVDWAFDVMGLEPDKARATSPFHYSGGEQRLIAIAGVIALRPAYLVFDEPTAGLDPSAQGRLMALIDRMREEGCAVVVVSHDMQLLAEHASQVLLLGRGFELASGGAQQVLSQQELLAKAYLGELPLVSFCDGLRKRGLDLPEPLLTLNQVVAAISAAIRKES